MDDYKELIEQLLKDSAHYRYSGHTVIGQQYDEAATAIETLLSQLTVAQSERDVATKRIIELEQELAHSDEGLGIYESRIAQLENEKEDMWKELDRVKAERDAAAKCLEDAHDCETCEHMDTHPDCDVECLGCQKDCQCRDCQDGSNFKWRGEPGKTAMTNGDRFRRYTEEELVDLLYQDYLNFSDRDGTEDPSTKWCDMKGGCQGEETSECTTELHKACILRWLRSKVEEVTE